MFKLIKYLILLTIIAIVFFAVTGKKIQGKTMGEHAKAIQQSKFYRETLKDVRTIVGEAMKAVGEAISEDVTDDDREALEKVLKEDMKKSK